MSPEFKTSLGNMARLEKNKRKEGRERRKERRKKEKRRKFFL